MLVFEYELRGYGWATATFGNQDRILKMNVSYLWDTLPELYQSALSLTRGSRIIDVRFYDEPGQHWMNGYLYESNELELNLIWCFDWIFTEIKPDLRFLRMRARTTLKEYVQAVLKLRDQLEKTNSHRQYREQWLDHKYPKRKSIQLSKINLEAL